MNCEAVIVAIGRSPVGRARKGCYRNLHPVDLAAQTLRGVLNQIPQLDVADIGDMIVGCAQPEGAQGFNVARMIAQRAELPDVVCGQTVNRFCSSGLQAVAACANAIMAGQEEVMIAGGIESMSLVDMTATDITLRNPWLEEHIPGLYQPMGITAETVADRYQVSRADMEVFAAASHKKAAEAQDGGALGEFIVPIETLDDEGNKIIVIADEGIRRGATVETLSFLKPCFKEDGKVTAGTSSQMSDGAGFVVLMSKEKAEASGLKYLAVFRAFAVAGTAADVMGMGPVVAVPAVMKKTGLSLEQMDIIELNEAFAAQAIPCIDELGMRPEIINPYGGAIALGHPMGATGIVLICKVLTYLQQNNGRYGLITMCIGGGMGAAGIIERDR